MKKSNIRFLQLLRKEAKIDTISLHSVRDNNSTVIMRKYK
jgi:hypothetical protein